MKNQDKELYRIPDKKKWIGRASNPNLGNQYWYEEVELKTMDFFTEEVPVLDKEIVLLGYVCDEGVRRNQGRVGAKEGPNALRKYLGKLPLHFENKRIIDLGDVVCQGKEMEECQATFSEIVVKVNDRKALLIAIGGGHDIAYAHCKGVKKSIENRGGGKLGIINFDAHFDLRPVESKPNSGTPFNQLLSEAKEKGKEIDYFVIGIQQQANTRELFEIAKNNKVDYVLSEDCESSEEKINVIKEKLDDFIKKNDYLYVTIDLDAFSSAYALGVSAPSPLGFTPSFFFKIMGSLLASKKVISCDIAELNPSLDKDNMTVVLAARIIDFLVMNR